MTPLEVFLLIAVLVTAPCAVGGLILGWLAYDRGGFLDRRIDAIWKRLDKACEVGGSRNQRHIARFVELDGNLERLEQALAELAKGPPSDGALKACVAELERKVERMQAVFREAGGVDPEAETETNIAYVPPEPVYGVPYGVEAAE